MTYTQQAQAHVQAVVKPISPEAARRRLKLRVAVKLMLWVAIAATAYVFMGAMRTSDDNVPQVPSLRVVVGDMEKGEARLLDWEGRPVIVYRRLAADLKNLQRTDPRLLDAASDHSSQPARMVNEFRSLEPDWFVAIAAGTDLGCSLSVLQASESPFMGEPWHGGFVDSCRQARYDFAGRVYRSQYADRNLAVPDYRFSDGALILGGSE